MGQHDGGLRRTHWDREELTLSRVLDQGLRSDETKLRPSFCW